MTQLIIAILLYCDSKDFHRKETKECRRQLMNCVLSETTAQKDVKLVQCIRQREK